MNFKNQTVILLLRCRCYTMPMGSEAIFKNPYFITAFEIKDRKTEN